MSFRNYNPTHFDWILLPWMLPSYRWLAEWDASYYTGNSRDANTSYADWIGLDPKRIVFVPNTIGDFADCTPALEVIDETRQQFGCADSKPVILGVFRLSDEKDPRTFLLVCDELMKKLPRLTALIVGDGKLRNELVALVQILGIQGKVRFLGYRSDVNILMAVSTLLLHTSVREGMSNVVMEAQALGLPVVATQIPGITEAVRDGESAFLCPPGQVEFLTEACLKVISDPDLRERMGSIGKKFVSTNFGVKSFGSSYLQIGTPQNH